MKVVGITGPMGSGKSLVAAMASAWGFPVFQADDVSKKLLDLPKNKAVIVNRWGQTLISTNGNIDRAALAEIVFRNEEELHFLNSLLHPQVHSAFASFVASHKTHSLVFRESALLVPEILKQTDVMLLVLTSRKLALERVQKRSGMTEATYSERREKQPELRQYLAPATHILINTEQVSLLKQFDSVIEKINK